MMEHQLIALTSDDVRVILRELETNKAACLDRAVTFDGEGEGVEARGQAQALAYAISVINRHVRVAVGRNDD